MLKKILCVCVVAVSLALPLRADTLYLFSGDSRENAARAGSIHRFKIDSNALIPAPSANLPDSIWDKSDGQPTKGMRVNDVVIAPNGDVYASSRDTDSVLRFDGQSGAFKSVVVELPSTPDGLAIGSDGNLYIASGSLIARCSLDGKPLPSAGQNGNVFAHGGNLVAASGLTFGPDGNLYVASQSLGQVLRYDGRSGAYMDVFVKSNIMAASQIAFGPDGNLYVASVGGPAFDAAGGYVARFDGATGEFLDKFAPDAKGAMGLAFAPNGELFVSSYWTNKITRYDSKTGKSLGVVAESPEGSAFYYLTMARQYDKAAAPLKPVVIDVPRRMAPRKAAPAIAQGANTIKGWQDALKPKGVPGPWLTLASKQATDYVILLPAKPTPMDEKAAEVLAEVLQEMTGAEYSQLREGAPVKAGTKVISVGRTARLQKSGLAEAKLDLGEEGYAIAAQGDTLFLLGGKTRGPIYAVYSLLEEDLGCRWYANANTPRIPRVETLRFRPALRHSVPLLKIRHTQYYETHNNVWSLENKARTMATNMPAEWGGDAMHPPGYLAHTYDRLVPPEKYFKEHPEYFAEVNGKRQKSQLDLSNPDVLRIVIETVKSELRANPDSRYISISPNDGRGYCECSICSAIDKAEATAPNSKSGSLFNFVNKVAAAIKSEFPAVMVTTLAYLDTFTPPKTIRPRKNVAVWLATDSHAWKYQFCFTTESQEFQNALKAWNALGTEIYIWDYTTDYVHSLVPMINMPVVTANMKFYMEHGAKGIMLEGDSMGWGGERNTMRGWVWTKQMWNPDLDTRALMRDFIYGHYGTAAEPIWQYNMMLWQMWETAHAIPHKNDDTKPVPNPLLLNDSPCSAPPDWMLLSEDYLAKTTQYFAQAEALAQDPETLSRVHIAKLPLLYIKLAQGLGYITEFGEYVPGSWIKTRNAAQKASYQALLQEFVKLMEEGNVKYISAFTTAKKITDQWRGILGLSDAKLSVLKLSDQWKFKTDADKVGVAQNWAVAQTNDAEWAEVSSHQDKGWESQGFADYKGTAWYRQRFTIPANFQRYKHVYVYFGAVDSESEIYLNGTKVFDHTIAGTGLTVDEIWNAPFAFDAAPYLKAGEENILAVRVSSNGGVRGVWKPAFILSSDDNVSAGSLKLMMPN